MDSRLVKFIGDAVMWVSSTPESLVQTAVDLVEDPRTQEAGLQVRAGLSFGDVLAIGGDYFGDVVNLAARLAAAASPGQILASSAVSRQRFRNVQAIAQDPLTLKGFDEPVVAFDMRRGGRLMVDFDALEAAGIANARERAALIDYLDGLGFTAEDMVEAERSGRLFGLAGDALQRSGRPIYTLREAAGTARSFRRGARHGLAYARAERRRYGPAGFSQVDIDGLTSWVALKSALGEDSTLTLLRVLGASMARLAEAGSTAIRLGLPDIQMEHSADELDHGYRRIAPSASSFRAWPCSSTRCSGITRSAPAPTSKASSATPRRAWSAASDSPT